MSFVEMLVALALYVIVGGAMFTSIIAFYRYNDYTIAQAYQVTNARLGVENMVRDLREMTFADDGSFPFVSLGSTTVSFYSDIDRDDSVELVTYELIDTTVTKYVYNASGTPPTYPTSTPGEVLTISRYVQNNLQGIPNF